MNDQKKPENREGWEAAELAAQASQKNVDEIQRELLRGDETRGDADARDYAGAAHPDETPQGREEAKNDRPEKANANG